MTENTEVDDDNYTEEDDEGAGIEPQEDTRSEDGGKGQSPGTDRNDVHIEENSASIKEDEKEKHAELLDLPPHGSEVFIGGLSPDISEEDLRELCEPFGDNFEGYWGKQGFAFVAFRTKDEAQKAIEDLHNKEFKARTLRRSLSETKYRLFIGNVPKSWTENEFRRIIEATGPGAETIELVKERQWSGFIHEARISEPSHLSNLRCFSSLSILLESRGDGQQKEKEKNMATKNSQLYDWYGKNRKLKMMWTSKPRTIVLHLRESVLIPLETAMTIADRYRDILQFALEVISAYVARFCDLRAAAAAAWAPVQFEETAFAAASRFVGGIQGLYRPIALGILQRMTSIDPVLGEQINLEAFLTEVARGISVSIKNRRLSEDATVVANTSTTLGDVCRNDVILSRMSATTHMQSAEGMEHIAAISEVRAEEYFESTRQGHIQATHLWDALPPELDQEQFEIQVEFDYLDDETLSVESDECLPFDLYPPSDGAGPSHRPSF